jgi:hypothetical protein
MFVLEHQAFYIYRLRENSANKRRRNIEVGLPAFLFPAEKL